MDQPRNFPYRVNQLRDELILAGRGTRFSRVFREKLLQIIEVNLEAIARGVLPAPRFRWELFRAVSNHFRGNHIPVSADPFERCAGPIGPPINIKSMGDAVNIKTTDDDLIHMLWRNEYAPGPKSTKANPVQRPLMTTSDRINLVVLPDQPRAPRIVKLRNRDVDMTKSQVVRNFSGELASKRTSMIRKFHEKYNAIRESQGSGSRKEGMGENGGISENEYVAAVDAMLSIHVRLLPPEASRCKNKKRKKAASQVDGNPQSRKDRTKGRKKRRKEKKERAREARAREARKSRRAEGMPEDDLP